MSGTLSVSDFLAAEHSLYGRTRLRGLARWDARLKLALIGVLLLANVLIPRAALSAFLWILAWAALLWTRVPWRQAVLFVLAPLWATLLVVLGYGWGFGREPLFHVLGVAFYKEGLLQGGAAGLRVLAEMSLMAALMLSTPFRDILAALRWWRVPTAFTELLAAMYRYVFLLFDEYQSMRAAAQARGGYSNYLSGMRTLGLILAQIFMRALDRAERIEQAMRVRGRDSLGQADADLASPLSRGGTPYA